MGGVISIFQAEKPRAEGQLAPSTPAPPPPLAGGGWVSGGGANAVQVFCFQAWALSPRPCCLLEPSGKAPAVEMSICPDFGAWPSRAWVTFHPASRPPLCLLPPPHRSPCCQGNLQAISRQALPASQISLFSLFIFFLYMRPRQYMGWFLVYSRIWYIILVLSKTSSLLHSLLDLSFDIHLLRSYYVLSTVLDNWGNKHL